MGEKVPPTDIRRWTPSRKEAVLRAIARGEITIKGAIERWVLSPDEIAAWQRDYALAGRAGLRVRYRLRIHSEQKRGRGGRHDRGSGRYSSSSVTPVILAK